MENNGIASPKFMQSMQNSKKNITAPNKPVFLRYLQETEETKTQESGTMTKNENGDQAGANLVHR
jgi:hypothetical protein